MSSIGASCARVYMMKKKTEEKLQRMEQERGRRGGGESSKAAETAKHGGASAGKSNKVHPGNIGIPAGREQGFGFHFQD